MKVNGVDVDVHDYDGYSALTHMKTNKRISSYESRMEAHEAQKSGKKVANPGKIIFYIILIVYFGPTVLSLLFAIFVALLGAVFGF